MGRKPSAERMAARLADIYRISVCEGCEVLRGANLYAMKHYGTEFSALFKKNLSQIITTHVDLGCKKCPVDDVMKMLRKDRLAAIAAMF